MTGAALLILIVFLCTLHWTVRRRILDKPICVVFR